MTPWGGALARSSAAAASTDAIQRAQADIGPIMVFTMPESAVYHLRRDCPALNRSDRYYPPMTEALGAAQRKRNGRNGTRGRRCCKLCERRST